jgi:transposase
MGLDRFTVAVRRELPRWGVTRPCLRIVRAVFAALSDPAGVAAHRPGALERAHLALGDWRSTRERLADVEAWMAGVLDDLQLTGLVTTIAGLTPVGAAAILAETGDPARFATPRALARHAGLCPRDNASGAFPGKAPVSGRGRPALRLAAWRAVRAALPNNPVMTARFAHLTTREHNRLARQQARTACAAALLRWIHVVVTQRVAWDPAIAAGAKSLDQAANAVSTRLTPGRRLTAGLSRPGRGEPERTPGTHLAHEQGQPRPSPHQARFTLPGETRLKARQSTRRRRSTRPMP